MNIPFDEGSETGGDAAKPSFPMSPVSQPGGGDVAPSIPASTGGGGGSPPIPVTTGKPATDPVTDINIPNQSQPPIRPPSVPSYTVDKNSMYPCKDVGFFREPSNCKEFYTCKEISPGMFETNAIFEGRRLGCQF